MRAPSLRTLAGTMALADLVLVVLVERRSRLVRFLLGPPAQDYSTWSQGVIATYTLAQAAIAVRPTPGGARVMATLRAVLIGGDLRLAARATSVDRRLGYVTATGNALLTIAALRAAHGGGGTRADTRGRSLPHPTAMV